MRSLLLGKGRNPIGGGSGGVFLQYLDFQWVKNSLATAFESKTEFFHVLCKIKSTYCFFNTIKLSHDHPFPSGERWARGD